MSRRDQRHKRHKRSKRRDQARKDPIREKPSTDTPLSRKRYALFMCVVSVAVVGSIGMEVYRALSTDEHVDIPIPLLFIALMALTETTRSVVLWRRATRARRKK